MGLNRAKLTTFYSCPSSTHSCFISRVNTSGCTRQTLDDNNQHLPTREYRAYPSQYGYPLLFGRYLCTLIGERKFLTVYFIGGILGSILYVLLGPPLSIAIGASGAVFAVGGALVVMRPKLRVFVFPIPVPLPLWAAVIGGFLIISFFPNVAWQAHLGGLAFGLTIGYFFKKRPRLFF